MSRPTETGGPCEIPHPKRPELRCAYPRGHHVHFDGQEEAWIASYLDRPERPAFEALARQLTRDRMTLYGYTSEEIDAAEPEPDHSWCGRLVEPFPGWDCVDEEGRHRHPVHREMDQVGEFVVWLLERLEHFDVAGPAKAVAVAEKHGNLHNVRADWVIDQMVRSLLGDGYEAWRTTYDAAHEAGVHVDTWSEGIAPWVEAAQKAAREARERQAANDYERIEQRRIAMAAEEQDGAAR